MPNRMVKPLRIRKVTLLYAASSPNVDSSAKIVSRETLRIRIRRSLLYNNINNQIDATITVY